MPRSLSRQMRAAVAYVMLNPGCNTKEVVYSCYPSAKTDSSTGYRAVLTLVKRGLLIKSGRMLFTPAFYTQIPSASPLSCSELIAAKAGGSFLRYD